MKRRTIQIRLLMICGILSIGILVSSTVRAQATDSAAIFPKTAAASIETCEERLQIASQRLDKALSAFETSQKALTAALTEIEARKQLNELKDEYLKVKDQMIADIFADNKFLRGKVNGPKSQIRKILERIEKIALFAGGVYLGRL